MGRYMRRFTMPGVHYVAISVLLIVVLSVACGHRKYTESGADTFSIGRTEDMCIVDGRLDESFWHAAVPVDGFRIDGKPDRIPAKTTVAYLAYGPDALHAAFVCEDSQADVLAGKSSGATNEYCELLTFSRPETPYYSPYLQRLDYQNANNAVRTQRSFRVWLTGKTGDANIYKTGAHTPYITDEGWSGDWKGAVTVDKHGYIAELSIPWETIGGLPGPGDDFKIHFVRRQSASDEEFSVISHINSENLYIPSMDPADFNQEHPQIFSPMVFYGDHAVLSRYVELEPPWFIDRSDAAYESVLTGLPWPHRSAHFYLGMRGFLLPDSIRSRYDDETWAQEEDNFTTELGRARASAQFLPGIMNRYGASGVDSLYAEYGMTFSYHGSGNGKQALESGASYIRPGGAVAFFDPVYAGIKRANMAGWLKTYGKEPWLFDTRGQDEPFNQIATILQPGTYEKVDRELRQLYGVGLQVPEGVAGLPYQDQPVHENSRSLPGHDTALSRIAMFRWLNRQYYETAKKEFEVVKRHTSDALYEAYNRNAVADMDFLDQSLIHDITDYVSVDPYPSFCIYVYGTARSRYHVGFSSKFVTDMASGKPTQIIMQGCDMIQRYSTPANVREWASQAAKTGATMLDWWGTPRLDHPDLYREMLGISKLWKELPALDIPDKADIGVLFSDDSRVAAGDEALHAHYSLHVILGERLGAWYEFVSENHVRKGLHTLEGKKLLIAPHLAYLSREFGEMLIDRVKDGATLVLLDPDAFLYDIETGALRICAGTSWVSGCARRKRL